MGDTGSLRSLHGWQRANVLTAATYLRELLARHPGDPRLRAVHAGLLETLDPSRRAVRLQREATDAATLRADKRSGLERRRDDRRAGVDRRVVGLGPPTGLDRRCGERREAARRSGSDRRRR